MRIIQPNNIPTHTHIHIANNSIFYVEPIRANPISRSQNGLCTSHSHYCVRLQLQIIIVFSSHQLEKHTPIEFAPEMESVLQQQQQKQ